MRASTYRYNVAPRDRGVLVKGRPESKGTITRSQKHLYAVRRLGVNCNPRLAAVEVETELLLRHIVPDEVLYAGQIPSLTSQLHRKLGRRAGVNKSRGQK